MSVRVDKYFGWTVELKNELNSEDFDFYNEFRDSHQNLSQYGKGALPNEIKLVVNGMSGLFARLIYIVSVSYDVSWVEEDNDILNQSLKEKVIPDNILNELNIVYMQLMGEKLKKEQVALKEWHNWG